MYQIFIYFINIKYLSKYLNYLLMKFLKKIFFKILKNFIFVNIFL